MSKKQIILSLAFLLIIVCSGSLYWSYTNARKDIPNNSECIFYNIRAFPNPLDTFSNYCDTITIQNIQGKKHFLVTESSISCRSGWFFMTDTSFTKYLTPKTYTDNSSTTYYFDITNLKRNQYYFLNLQGDCNGGLIHLYIKE